jgi:hypothetical protein
VSRRHRGTWLAPALSLVSFPAIIVASLMLMTTDDPARRHGSCAAGGGAAEGDHNHEEKRPKFVKPGQHTHQHTIILQVRRSESPTAPDLIAVTLHVKVVYVALLVSNSCGCPLLGSRNDAVYAVARYAVRCVPLLVKGKQLVAAFAGITRRICVSIGFTARRGVRCDCCTVASR